MPEDILPNPVDDYVESLVRNLGHNSFLNEARVFMGYVLGPGEHDRDPAGEIRQRLQYHVDERNLRRLRDEKIVGRSLGMAETFYILGAKGLEEALERE